MSNADKPPKPEQPAWARSRRGLGTVRLSHADLMQQIRQQPGYSPAPLVQLAHIQPKRENRIALMVLRAAESSRAAHHPEIHGIGLLQTSPDTENVLLEALLKDSTTVDKTGLLQEVEEHLARSEAPKLRAQYADMLYRSGMFDQASHQAYRAAEFQPSAIALLVHGRSLSWLEPERALEVLQLALQFAETTHGALQVACLQEIIATLIRLGRYVAASRWAQWALEAQSQQLPSNTGTIRDDLLQTWQMASALSGRSPMPAFKITDTGQGPLSLESKLAQVDLLLACDNQTAGLESIRSLWQHNHQRLNLAPIALRLVPLLIASDQPQAALDVAQHTLELSAGLHPLLQRNAHLVHAIAISACDPAAGILALEHALQAHTKPLDALNLARAGLRLARIYEQFAQPEQAQAALHTARAGLAELSLAGQQMLGVFTQRPAAPTLELKFLGSSEAKLGEVAVPLRRRFAEILTVLAMHPAGLSGEQLSLAIYGEQGTPECCKTELSRLRHLVHIETRPYRIGVPVKADFLELACHLEKGQLEQAMQLHRGPLLPGSDAPAIVHQREHLSESLRNATFKQGNPAQLWQLAERDEHDLEIWQRLLNLLRASDPRHAIVQARVSGLHRAWNV